MPQPEHGASQQGTVTTNTAASSIVGAPLRQSEPHALSRRRLDLPNHHPRARPGGRAAADGRAAAREPERRSFRPHAKCRHGLGSRRSANGKQFLILSTQGGLRAPDGTPIALGYHTGHWEIGLLVEAAARELRALGAVPFAARVLRSVRRPHAGHARACSTRCPIATTRRSSSAGSSARCRAARACSASRPATRVCPR